MKILDFILNLRCSLSFRVFIRFQTHLETGAEANRTRRPVADDPVEDQALDARVGQQQLVDDVVRQSFVIFVLVLDLVGLDLIVDVLVSTWLFAGSIVQLETLLAVQLLGGLPRQQFGEQFLQVMQLHHYRVVRFGCRARRHALKRSLVQVVVNVVVHAVLIFAVQISVLTVALTILV